MLLIWWSSSWFHGKIEQYHLKVILEKNKDNWKFSIVMSFQWFLCFFQCWFSSFPTHRALFSTWRKLSSTTVVFFVFYIFQPVAKEIRQGSTWPKRPSIMFISIFSQHHDISTCHKIINFRKVKLLHLLILEKKKLICYC